MSRALDLAWKGWGRVQPNPLVGAVLLKDGNVVAEGWHAEFGGLHAEAVALEAAGGTARGATAVVTLEPCSHQGKQPPCADALIAAGVRRVVAAMADPNPVAAGGAARLRAAGVEVEIGVLERAAAAQNAVFLHNLREPARPFVALKLATTIDGRIADAKGNSRWVSGINIAVLASDPLARATGPRYLGRAGITGGTGRGRPAAELRLSLMDDHLSPVVAQFRRRRPSGRAHPVGFAGRRRGGGVVAGAEMVPAPPWTRPSDAAGLGLDGPGRPRPTARAGWTSSAGPAASPSPCRSPRSAPAAASAERSTGRPPTTGPRPGRYAARKCRRACPATPSLTTRPTSSCGSCRTTRGSPRSSRRCGCSALGRADHGHVRHPARGPLDVPGGGPRLRRLPHRRGGQ